MNYGTDADVSSNKYEVVDVPAYGVKVLVDQKAIFSIIGTEMNFEVARCYEIICLINRLWSHVCILRKQLSQANLRLRILIPKENVVVVKVLMFSLEV